MKCPPPFLALLLVLLLVSSVAATSTFPKEALPTKSGYLKVNSTTGSAIFYTYYESQAPHTTETPILIWLQGGPGCSSMLANFFELGPYQITQDLTLKPNPYSWNNNFGLLFLDNPIGTGLSIAASPQEIPRNQKDVAQHLLIAITKFAALDKSFKTRPLYLTGESYAGKYLPALGYYILQNSSAWRKIFNFAGIAIGNGLTDPETQVSTHASNAYNLGLINQKQTALLEKLQSEVVRFIRRGKWNEAGNARTRVLDSLTNMTGLATLYDFRKLSRYPNGVVAKFLNNGTRAKRALGAKESIQFELCSKDVGDALHDDVMRSVRYMVEYVVRKGVKVLLYQGQCDLRDGVYSTLAWVEKMSKWDGLGEFLKAERSVWRVDGNLAGYVQKYKRFSHAVVLNAGHLVPTDQPFNSLVLMQDWVLERGLFLN